MNTEMNQNPKQKSHPESATVKAKAWYAKIHQVYPTQPLNAYQRGVVQVSFFPVTRAKENLF
jgi:hypothetical protein